jgi:hypothetical protein
MDIFCESIKSSWYQVWFNLKKYRTSLEICPILQIWADRDDSHVWVIKSVWIGFKIGTHALHLIWVAWKISWILDKGYFGFGVDIVDTYVAVFIMQQWGKMWNLVAIEKFNDAKIFIAGRWLSEPHIHQNSWSLELYIWLWIILWSVQNLPEKWQFLDWSKVTLIERSSSWNHDYSKLGNLSLVLRWAWSMKVMSIRSLDCRVHLAHRIMVIVNWGTQV